MQYLSPIHSVHISVSLLRSVIQILLLTLLHSSHPCCHTDGQYQNEDDSYDCSFPQVISFVFVFPGFGNLIKTGTSVSTSHAQGAFDMGRA